MASRAGGDSNFDNVRLGEMKYRGKSIPAKSILAWQCRPGPAMSGLVEIHRGHLLQPACFARELVALTLTL
jgi:hypothetical protein